MLFELLIINFFNVVKGVEDEVVFMFSDLSRWKVFINEIIYKLINFLLLFELYIFK